MIDRIDVQNNPVNFRDFLGLSEISDVNGGYADNGGLGYNGGVDSDSVPDVSPRTDIAYLDISNPKYIPGIDDVIGPGTVIDVATAIATTFAEKGGSISSGLATGL